MDTLLHDVMFRNKIYPDVCLLWALLILQVAWFLWVLRKSNKYVWLFYRWFNKHESRKGHIDQIKVAAPIPPLNLLLFSLDSSFLEYRDQIKEGNWIVFTYTACIYNKYILIYSKYKKYIYILITYSYII